MKRVRHRYLSIFPAICVLALVFSCNHYNLLDQLENPGGGSGHGGGSGQATSCGANCRIFVTADFFSGNLGGVFGADNFCRFDPANPDGSGLGNWKAMLASNSPQRRACGTINCQVAGASENVDWPLRPNTSYRRPDGMPIGITSANAIFETSLSNPIGTGTGIAVWTGLDLNWQTSSNTCNNWTDGSGSQGDVGYPTDVIYSAFKWTTTSCPTVNRLYCVEQ